MQDKNKNWDKNEKTPGADAARWKNGSPRMCKELRIN